MLCDWRANFTQTLMHDLWEVRPRGAKPVVDWKSDVVPTAEAVERYRAQVRSYLKALGAAAELIVFVTTGTIVGVSAAA